MPTLMLRSAIALLVAVTWGIGATLPIGAYLGGESTFLDSVSTWVFSAMFLTIGAAAWLVASQAGGMRTPIAIGWAIAIAATGGAAGNVLEDVFRIPGRNPSTDSGSSGCSSAISA